MNRIQVIIVFGLFFLFQPLTHGQTNQNIQNLQKVGVLDSIYSKNLKEYRKFYVQLPANYNENALKFVTKAYEISAQDYY